ncbi:MAG: tetratricopeptide repeat protein [Prevotella sp.]|nr:tetratricopeptide repeat protein [Prevotella sp.]
MAKKIITQGAPETQPAQSKHEEFFLKYKNAIIGAVVALIVIICGIIFYNNHKKGQLKEAQTAMATPELSMQLGMSQLQQSTTMFDSKLFEQALNGDSTGTAMGFLKIADEYSSTKAGNLANLYAGLCYAHMDKWEDAVKYLEKFDDVDDYLISPAALGALGNAYAHVNQLDKAVSTLTKAAEKADNILMSPIYYIQAGEILEGQGKKADALKLYQKVKGMQSMSQSSPHVEMIDEYIERVSE